MVIFKRITAILGIIFLLVTSLAVIKPEPFLKFGYLGIFISTALGGTSLIVFSLAKHFHPIGLAFAMASGMAVNDSVAWVIGTSSNEILKPDGKFKKIEATVQKYGSVAIFFWSLIPFPYDLIGFVAGYLKLPYYKYVIPTFLGKFIRLTIIGLFV